MGWNDAAAVAKDAVISSGVMVLLYRLGPWSSGEHGRVDAREAVV